ncbi:tautomerase-like protein [Motilibacter rhizosphaerae]|uniref:Tautomerase-like protein n=1 Tax=Motilibacter rhizosphaerae TaxID=598652 RepID=A0A4V2F4H7_9ACTN|nr:tautomerase family protein [Motilibacter rhizosphaerae]RZS89359.1 tautomerase-like protein [Motilibacter rhizosphaerae]
MQVKVYAQVGLRPRRSELSDALHRAAVRAVGLPEDKRFHRFLWFEPEDFLAPPGRTAAYVVVEVLLFEGRSVDAKKRYYAALVEEFAALGIGADDLEVTLVETPRHDWLIRGVPGDELALAYRVEA